MNNDPRTMRAINEAVSEAIAAFADRIADEIERRIATRNGATAAALAEMAEIVRACGRGES